MCQAPQWDKCFEGFHAQTQWDTHTRKQSAKAKLTWSGQFHHNSNSKKVILLLDDNLALSITQSKPSQLPNLDVPWPFFVMESCMNYICVPGVPQPHYSTFAASLSECGWLPDTNVRPVLWASQTFLNYWLSELLLLDFNNFIFELSRWWATSSLRCLLYGLLLLCAFSSLSYLFCEAPCPWSAPAVVWAFPSLMTVVFSVFVHFFLAKTRALAIVSSAFFDKFMNPGSYQQKLSYVWLPSFLSPGHTTPHKQCSAHSLILAMI